MHINLLCSPIWMPVRLKEPTPKNAHLKMEWVLQVLYKTDLSSPLLLAFV